MEKIKHGWQRFCHKHPKLSELLVQFIKFYAFSLAVTFLQYLMLTVMPGIYASLTNWEEYNCYLIPIFNSGYYIFNYSVANGGMAYFAAYATTLFIAQCINFPMQRNVVFKSKGNVFYQACWYLVAFVLIFLVCNGLQTFYQPLLQQYLVKPSIYNIVITFINGGVQMVIYFPIYRIIFKKEKTPPTSITVDP